LEDFIVWITNESKLYAFCLSDQDALQTSPSHSPFEVPGYAADGRELKDIQGQFQRFGVFTAAGEVLAGDVSYLKRCAEAVRNDPQLIETGDWSALTDLLAARPQDVPALQHTNVIGLAYGDYHYHALHADGKITSYGRDSQSCGALGLSGLTAGGRFRGLRRAGLGMRADADLLPIANVRGRQIWFEPERKDWLQWLEDELDQDNMRVDGNRARSLWEQDTAKAAAFSEWIEQEGRHWDEGPVSSTSSSPGTENPKQESAGDYANLGAYFAIGIAAAGWHSGALVLKDEEKAHEIRSKWVAHREPDEHGIPAMPGAFEQLDLDEVYLWKKEGFPKVSLPDGYEMPGVGEPRPWRDGMPTMHELGLEDT
jgi:SCF-associated factor 1